MRNGVSSRRYEEYRRRRREAGELRLDDNARPQARHALRRTFFSLFAAYWRLLGVHRATFVAALATLTVATGVSLTMPASTKVALDYILTDNPGPAGLPDWLPRDRVTLLWILGGALMGATLLTILFGLWGRFQTTRLVKRVQASLKRRLFEHAVRLPLSRVYQLKSGGVASILREDAGGAGDLLFSMIYNPWRAVVQLLGTLVILAAVDWRMLVGALILVPLVWVSHRAWIARIRPIYRDIRNTRSGIDAHATEAFAGMRVVRGFNRQQGEAARFTVGNHFMARQELLAWWWSRGVEIAWQVLIPGASAAVLVYGGSRVVGGHMTIGDVMMFSAYLLMLLGPLEALASSATSIQNNLAGFDRVLDLMDEPKEFADSSPSRSLERSRVRGEIRLDGVSFAYPSRDPKSAAKEVLTEISLGVPPGTTLALVGPSGAGKTTLCNLVARFYDPVRGRVLIDGVDLRDLDVEQYRNLLGIVEQDVFLFDGSVRQNIAYGRRGVSDDEVRAAAEAANAHGFITELERGYGTLIGERGVRLSGGQKQRIAIARAVLADPAILILDEATSNLDTESERLIQASLRRLMRGRTSFVIAHRLSTIRHADQIAVIDGGRLAELGTHDELMAAEGLYAKYLRLQLTDPDDSGTLDPGFSSPNVKGAAY